MRHLPFLFIFASLAFGQEVEPPENPAAEERIELLTAQLDTERIKGKFAINQAKLNGCSSELVQNWRQIQNDLNKKFQAAAEKEQKLRKAIEEKYAVEGYTLSPQLAWVKDPGD